MGPAGPTGPQGIPGIEDNCTLRNCALTAQNFQEFAQCIVANTTQCEGGGQVPGGICTLTQGYWKNHEDAWPEGTMTLGSVEYTQEQLQQILDEPVRGNDLISLAHQLIAAKLNAARGAVSPQIGAAIAEADSLIGSLVVPPVGDGFLDSSAAIRVASFLESYNSGNQGFPHCD